MTHGAYAEQVLAILEEATGISGTTHLTEGRAFPSGMAFLPGAAVKFPDDSVVTADRVGMWVEGGHVCMSMWPGELQPQYKRLYSDPRKIEALGTLSHERGWQLNSNFHLAHRFAAPQQRWYPRRRLAGREYVRQWIDDFRDGRAGGRTRAQLEDPGFLQWLVERGYAADTELTTLDAWLSSKSPGIQIHIRPSVEVLRTWQLPFAVAPGPRAGFVAEVRQAIDQVLAALGEPELKKVCVGEASRRAGGAAAPDGSATQMEACPTCHIDHAGECY